MKVGVIVCGRLENRYAVEFVEHYKKLGFDQIFIADNNRNNEEHFEEVLQSYVNENFVTIYNYRDISMVQFKAYKEIYRKISDNLDYDWLFYCDFDEFLILNKDNNIKDYLSRDCFKNINQILLNWMIYTDNNLITDDGRGCLERFTTPMEKNKHINYTSISENSHVKPIIRTKFNIYLSTPHSFFDFNILDKTTSNNYGKICPVNYYTQEINYDLAYIKHFTTKTIEEWIKNKLVRGTEDRDTLKFNATYDIPKFFKYNDIIDEKLNYIKSLGINTSNIII